MIKEATDRLIRGDNLTRQEMETVMDEIMTGQSLPTQIASFLTALRMKGETIEEITGAAIVMRKHVERIKLPTARIVFDCCGTGGDRAGTINVSTVASFVIAGSGVSLAKHGNRSVSSRCGSADLMEALGVNINITAPLMQRCLEEAGIAFLYAPLLHPAMKYATPVRREIGIRTVFNILGPLTNPAFATHQLLGVYEAGLVEPIAHVLANLGLRHILVVHGQDGLDEVSISAPTDVCEYKGGSFKKYRISPEDFGIARVDSQFLKGGDVEYNKKITLEILKGKKGPYRDIVVFNAGCGLYAADRVKDIGEGILLANKSIDSGKALEKLELLRKLTNP